MWKTMALVFLPEISREYASENISSSVVILLMLFANWSKSVALFHITRSSANPALQAVSLLKRSSLRISMKSKGLGAEPCGRPVLSWIISE